MADNPDPQDAAASGGRKWLIPLVALTIGVLAALVVSRLPAVQRTVGLVPAAAVSEVGAGDAPAHDEPVEFGLFAELDPIVINPRGTNGRRFLMVKVGVEAPKQKTLDALERRMPVTTDRVIEIFGGLGVGELTDITRRDSLKARVQEAVDGVLGEDGPVSRVYFTQYVLQ